MDFESFSVRFLACGHLPVLAPPPGVPGGGCAQHQHCRGLVRDWSWWLGGPAPSSRGALFGGDSAARSRESLREAMPGPARAPPGGHSRVHHPAGAGAAPPRPGSARGGAARDDPAGDAAAAGGRGVPPLLAPPPEAPPEIPEMPVIDLRRLILDHTQAPEGAELGAIVAPDWSRPLVARAFVLCLELCASHWLQLEQPHPYRPIQIKLRPQHQ
ncbi:potassium/sodium hyperpolarization-activated cyclic nucleotide-gated channel 4-like [Catharus ustulatus]|uniref:potassium/sodium hyperpolarization-activated cyclic nucleotide-gated channel 4-like n=1 Tax=Catharus ustulatus TaxID=91951 RepID=UPI00140CCFA1|nr:potassium/sodium hyperpolarization-activated cyclic nucleotide-gated channel 4-like [Catharus ustulatus]